MDEYLDWLAVTMLSLGGGAIIHTIGGWFL